LIWTFFRKNSALLSDDELDRLLGDCEKMMSHMETSASNLDENLNKFAALCEKKDANELKKSFNFYVEKIDQAIKQSSSKEGNRGAQ
jgi:hypothetical protein